MNDRTIGYIVLICIISLLILPAGYIICQSSAPKTIRKISFDNIPGLSFLAIQDPVRIRGVEVGTVTGIEFNAGSAIVTIRTDEAIMFHEGYDISVIPKGVMGDQYLMIFPGDSKNQLIPPDRLLQGRPSIGPDEALAYINILRKTVHALNIHIMRLKDGTTIKESLITQIQTLTTFIDTVAGSLLVTFLEIDTIINRNCNKTIALIDNALSVSSTALESFPTTLYCANDLLTSTDLLLTSTDAFLEQADSIVAKINDADISVFKKDLMSVSNNLTDLRSLLKSIGSDTLTLPVRLW